MSNARKKSVYTSRNTYVDHAKEESESFDEVAVKVETLESALLLLNSEEEIVLITILKHITEYVRKRNENLAVLREKNVLQLLLEKQFYITNSNTLVQRFALYLVTALVENMNTLTDLDLNKTNEILSTALNFYQETGDDFCLEYLSVIVSKCLNDPQVAFQVVKNQSDFLEKFFVTITNTENPDTLVHSFQALQKLLLIQSVADLQTFASQPLFPIDRIICDLTNEFAEVRSGALQLIKTLILDTLNGGGPFTHNGRAVYVLQQLTTMFCTPAMVETLPEVIDVLATAMRTERMAQYFFEYNLFDRIVQQLSAGDWAQDEDVHCRTLAVFAEIVRYSQFLPRVHAAQVTELLLSCLLAKDAGPPAPYVLRGLVRLMKHVEAANQIVEAYPHGVIAKLLKLLPDGNADMRTREQSIDLIGHLLLHAYHNTAAELLVLQMPQVLTATFSQGIERLSIDLMLSMLAIIEIVAQNEEYRLTLGRSTQLFQTLALLLKDSFSTSILVNHIFRCLCTVIEEEAVRETLLNFHITASIKRALKSMANAVKTSVTNFIIQTVRFAEYVQVYIDTGVLEVLIINHRHAFCVPTWGPAIDAILSKSPSLKFCIRNNLGFTDTTAGNDFLVPKQKFEDFRIFQNILKEEVSPLQPILVVNFQRPRNPSNCVVTVPKAFVSIEELTHEELEEGWSYCRQPGDDALPRYLQMLHQELDRQNLVDNGPKVPRAIDFVNVAKRARIIAEIVAGALSHGLKVLDLNSPEQCGLHTVQCHLKTLTKRLHCNFIPLGMVHTGCQFERAILFKALADQIGLPCTLQRSVDGRVLFNEVPLPVQLTENHAHCDLPTLKYMPWRMLRPTHIVDLLFNVGELYPLLSRQALQYLRLY